jgi:hypothetical protein
LDIIILQTEDSQYQAERNHLFVLYKTRTKCRQEQTDLILSLNQLRAYEIGFIYVQNEVF